MYLQEENISRKKKLRLFIHRSPSPFFERISFFHERSSGFLARCMEREHRNGAALYGKPFDLFVYYINVFLIMNNRQKNKNRPHVHFFYTTQSVIYKPICLQTIVKKFLVYQCAAVACRIQHQSLVVKLNSALSHRT